MAVFAAGSEPAGHHDGAVRRRPEGGHRHLRRVCGQGSTRSVHTVHVRAGDDRCLCLFEADDAEGVKAVNDTAGIPFTGVVEAMALTPG